MNIPDETNVSIIGAGVGIRALSTIIDGIILGIVGVVAAAVIGSSGSYYLFSLIFGFCYYTYFESSKGATPGKTLCGLKVVKTDGTPCDFEAAALRTICRIIDGLFIYLVAAILVWISVQNQRLGDKIAKTLVVRVK